MLLACGSAEPKLRGYTAFWHRAGSWLRPRRVIARIEAMPVPDPTPERPHGMRVAPEARYRQECDVRCGQAVLTSEAQQADARGTGRRHSVHGTPPA
jgi:hypothetical protein